MDHDPISSRLDQCVENGRIRILDLVPPRYAGIVYRALNEVIESLGDRRLGPVADRRIEDRIEELWRDRARYLHCPDLTRAQFSELARMIWQACRYIRNELQRHCMRRAGMTPFEILEWEEEHILAFADAGRGRAIRGDAAAAELRSRMLAIMHREIMTGPALSEDAAAQLAHKAREIGIYSNAAVAAFQSQAYRRLSDLQATEQGVTAVDKLKRARGDALTLASGLPLDGEREPAERVTRRVEQVEDARPDADPAAVVEIALEPALQQRRDLSDELALAAEVAKRLPEEVAVLRAYAENGDSPTLTAKALGLPSRQAARSRVNSARKKVLRERQKMLRGKGLR